MAGNTCRSCGARVIWAKSVATGKWMILDEEPAAEGNVVLTFTPQYGRRVVTVYRNAQAAEEACPGQPRYLDHHVTCPQAEDWRKASEASGRSGTVSRTPTQGGLTCSSIPT